jgi:N-acetylmuramoyl-L-alanine amidase
MSVPVAYAILPMSHRNRTGLKLTTKVPTLTLHNTGSPNASAENHSSFLLNNPDLNRSWHCTIDENSIVIHIPFNERAWHSATSVGNQTSLGFEVCEYTDYARSKKAIENAAWFCAKVLHDRGITPANGAKWLRTHESWSGKHCPHVILDTYGWSNFILTVITEMKKMSDVVAPVGDFDNLYLIHARRVRIPAITASLKQGGVYCQVLENPNEPSTSVGEWILVRARQSKKEWLDSLCTQEGVKLIMLGNVTASVERLVTNSAVKL